MKEVGTTMPTETMARFVPRLFQHLRVADILTLRDSLREVPPTYTRRTA